jgi:hypothetical protein
MPFRRILVMVSVLAMVWSAGVAAEPVNPYPRELFVGDKVREWTFDEGIAGWRAVHHSSVAPAGGAMRIRSTGVDPYVHSPVDLPASEILVVKLRARFRTAGDAQFFWATDKHRGTSEKRTARFAVVQDGKWREYEAKLHVNGRLTGLRLDPGGGTGEVDVDWIRIHPARLHPLEIIRVNSRPDAVTATVKNHSDKPLTFSVADTKHNAPAGKTVKVTTSLTGEAPFEMAKVVVSSPGLPALSRSVCVYRPNAKAKWTEHRSDDISLRVAADGSGAELRRGGKTVAILAPLVQCDGVIPKLSLTEAKDAVHFAADGLRGSLTLSGAELAVEIQSDRAVEGPVLRAIGPLAQGVFAGLEYLGKGESSSSKLDLEIGYLRYQPDPLKVTWPLLAVVTDRATTALTWTDPELQPRFAAPNFIDGASDHRMSLCGKKISATILVAPPGDVTEAILWGVRKRGLPPLPKSPRSAKEQRALCLRAFNGPLGNEKGWGHCVEEKWTRRFYADHASTVWRLTGKVPEKDGPLVPGGGHIQDETAFFVSGQANRWLGMQRRHASNLIKRQKPDGSFRYAGKYLRGHWEDTATGVCARPTMELLEFALQTGDAKAQAAGLKGLEFMKRFRTPRGAQFWELSIHTPDILAAGHLVRAYVLGYELTGKQEHLAAARKWALSGLPFVYLWGRYPIMPYATPPVFGATNWRAPLWIGRPVQWCGLAYAYGLTKLAPHDRTLDWRKVAEGILISGEQQQYPDGEKAGCFPDILSLSTQERAGPTINPVPIVVLRAVLDGEAPGLSVAVAAGRRVVAPFPVTIADGKARIRARAGVKYQIVVDGERIVDVTSKGLDVIELE